MADGCSRSNSRSNSSSNSSSSSSNSSSREVIPTTIINYEVNILAIGYYRGQTYFAQCRPGSNGKKTLLIKRHDEDGKLRNFKIDCLDWNDEFVSMEVHGRHMCILKQINHNPAANTVEDEITVIDLEKHGLIKHLTFKGCAAQNIVSMAVGSESLFHLNIRTWAVRRFSMYSNNDMDFNLMNLFPKRSNIDLISSTNDNYIMIEQDHNVSAIDIRIQKVIWKFPISGRGAFNCYNGIGIHLEGSKRRVWIININTGNTSLYKT